ncbi:MAG: HAD family hydrolase [Chloroflexi bacterium]|nr:HAD family hydrolase [Chloroflexota bacterium]
MTAARLEVAGISFDFGNTLIRADWDELRSVVATTAARLREHASIEDEAAFLAAWAVERDRQFRLQVPRLLEVDLTERVRHVLGGLRGAPVPAVDDDPWDEAAVAELVNDLEVELAVETYSHGFVVGMHPDPDAEGTLRWAREQGFRVAVLSNWPLARTIDRYVERQGWDAWLDAVVVSQRVGVIKPHPAIFQAAADALGLSPDRLLHVGDDWAADVVGAKAAGWHAAYLRGHQVDTPLPTSAPDASVMADLELDRLGDLREHVALARAGTASPTP